MCLRHSVSTMLRVLGGVCACETDIIARTQKHAHAHTGARRKIDNSIFHILSSACVCVYVCVLVCVCV